MPGHSDPRSAADRPLLMFLQIAGKHWIGTAPSTKTDIIRKLSTARNVFQLMLLHSAFTFIHNWPSSILVPIAILLPIPFSGYLLSDHQHQYPQHKMPGIHIVADGPHTKAAQTGSANGHAEPHAEARCTCTCSCANCTPTQTLKCCSAAPGIYGVHQSVPFPAHANVQSQSNVHLNGSHDHAQAHNIGHYGHGHSHVQVSESQARCGNSTTQVTTHTSHVEVREHLNHDVCFSLHQLNALTLPPFTFSSASHPPIQPCPVEARIPSVFKFDARLVRDELHHPLLCYLAEGVQPTLFNTGAGLDCASPIGAAAAKIVSGRQLLGVERPDGYRGLQFVAYGTLFLSINAALLEDTARNSCIDGKRLWSVSAPCGNSGNANLECRVGGVASVGVELHPSNVVSNAMIERVLALCKVGATFDSATGRAVATYKDGCPILHADALTLLAQVWTRFGRESHRKDASMTWVVLTNLERALVFRRTGSEIRVSHCIQYNGTSTPRDCVQNIYCLFLALAVLEKHQYTAFSPIDLVQLI